MKYVLFLIFALFATSVAAQDRDTIFGSEELLISVDMSSSFEIVPESQNAQAREVIVNFTLFPIQTAEQDVTVNHISPSSADVNENEIVFTWTNPSLGKHSFAVNSDVTTRYRAVRITGKTPFPLGSVPNDVKPYLAESEYMDYHDPAVTSLAYELASGENDQFVVVYKMAAWVNENVEYNLSTLTAEASEPASWVLTNRQGVCDEITNLFIALNRAVGIPARFVSGISYTDSDLFPEKWGFHGWAEVYFPEYGWVPFDVTYGEFGFVDPGHIKMLESESISATRTSYQWLGRDIDLKTQPLKPVIKVLDASGTVEPDVDITLTALKDMVGFGSYNVVEVALENTRPYYVVADFTVGRTTGLEMIGSRRRSVLLQPHETKYEYVTLMVDDSLKKGFIYTFPVSVSSVYLEVETSFGASEVARVFEEVDFERFVRVPNEEKTLSKNVDITCDSDRIEYYIYDTPRITCVVSNKGNVVLQELELCREGDCKSLSLGIGQQKQFDFTVQLAETEANREQVRLIGDEVSAQAVVEYKVKDVPHVQIASVEVPSTLSYKDNYEISFTLQRNTTSVPNLVHVDVVPTAATFNFPDLENNIKVTAELSAVDLQEGLNIIKIIATYEDENGNRYASEKDGHITVRELNILQQIDRFLTRLFS